MVALQFRRPATHLALQRLEGWLAVVLGGVFLTEITWAHHGGLFSRTGGCVRHAACVLRVCAAHHSHQHRTHKDQQHQMSGILWVASGALGLALAQQRVLTGVHVLLPAIGQAISAPFAVRSCLASCHLTRAARRRSDHDARAVFGALQADAPGARRRYA